MQTVFLKRGRDHPELLGRWEKGREHIRPTQRGRRAEPKFHGAMPPVAIGPATMGRLLERKASHLANMPPLPVPPCRQSGASCMDPCYDALVGATTPPDNKRGNTPAKCTPDRHQSESFPGLANTPQVGTCRVKIRAARRKSAKNRQGFDRVHKCTGTQVNRAKTLTGRARHQTSLQPQPAAR